MSLSASRLYDEAMTEPQPTRVCIVQEIVPRYRVPVFTLLAQQPGIELELWSDHRAKGSLKPAKGSGAYREVDAPSHALGPIIWQSGQLAAAKSDRFDVIIYPWNSRMIVLGQALRAARKRGVGTVIWGHGYSKDESPRRRSLRNRLLRFSDACLLYNHSAAKRLEDEGIDRRRIFVAQNAIDQSPIAAAREHWLAQPDKLDQFRSDQRIANGAFAIFISRLEPDKRIDLLLNAFRLVVKSRPDARLALIGTGSAEQALREQTRQLGLDASVIFAGGIYDDADLAPWFLSAACMAYPAAIGLSIFHAFGYGVPVVTSDDIPSHNPEIEAMRDGVNGLLYRDGDADDFAAKMLDCMQDHSRRTALGHQALQTVQPPEGFCIQRMVRGFVDAIAFARNAASSR